MITSVAGETIRCGQLIFYNAEEDRCYLLEASRPNAPQGCIMGLAMHDATAGEQIVFVGDGPADFEIAILPSADELANYYAMSPSEANLLWQRANVRVLLDPGRTLDALEMACDMMDNGHTITQALRALMRDLPNGWED